MKPIDIGSAPRVKSAASFHEGWRTVGVSRIGSFHASQQMPCQDSFGFGSNENWIWGAVADGVGSETHSQHGSQLAVDSVGQAIFDILEVGDHLLGESNARLVATRIVSFAQANLGNLADRWQIEKSRLDTTLQVVVFDKLAGKFVYFSIGDGDCVISFKDQLPYIVAHKRAKSDVGTVTLISDPCMEYLSVECIDLNDREFSSCLLFSDGLKHYLTKSNAVDSEEAAIEKPNTAIMKRVINSESEEDCAYLLSQLLAGIEKSYDQMADDKSLIAIAREEIVDPSTTHEHPSVVPTPTFPADERHIDEVCDDDTEEGAMPAGTDECEKREPISTTPKISHYLEKESERYSVVSSFANRWKIFLLIGSMSVVFGISWYFWEPASITEPKLAEEPRRSGGQRLSEESAQPESPQIETRHSLDEQPEPNAMPFDFR